MIHVTDWLPTLWHLASLEGRLKPNKNIITKPLDGVNQWLAISQLAKSSRNQFIINIDPLPVNCGPNPHAGVRWGDWKLIIGAGGPPMGWYLPAYLSDYLKHVSPDEHQMIIKRNNATPMNGNTDSGIELYNILEDPSETNNVYKSYPKIVKFLISLIKDYNTTAVPPGFKDYDLRSNPENFGGAWIPWL